MMKEAILDQASMMKGKKTHPKDKKAFTMLIKMNQKTNQAL